VALGLRLIPVVLTRQLGIGLDDMFQYDMLARSLASGNGYRWYAQADLARMAPYLHLNAGEVSLSPRGMLTTFRAPLYPAFLSVIYAISGVNDGRFFSARLGQTVLGASLAPLTYFVALVIPFRRPGARAEATLFESASSIRSARLAAWAVTAYPTLLLYPVALASENLFVVLVLASVLALLQLAQPATNRYLVINAAISGLLLGLAALTRSVILSFAALAILWIWLNLKRPRLAVVAAAALLVTITPWIVRNSMLAGKPTGIETSLGYNLYVGYHPQSTGTFTFGPSTDLLSILDDKQRDDVGLQRAVGFIRQDPSRIPYLAARRLGYFFDLELRAFTYFYVNDFIGYLPPPIMILCLLLLALPFVVVSVSAVYGAASLSWQPVTILLLFLFVGYLLPHVLTLSEERFHLTLLPFFAILAGRFWITGLGGLPARAPAVASLSVLVALLTMNWAFELGRAWPTLIQLFGPLGNQLYLAY
jgi:hypothetical protein